MLGRIKILDVLLLLAYSLQIYGGKKTVSSLQHHLVK